MNTDKAIKLFILTHKPFKVPENDLYVPIQVGAANVQPLGYLRDDTGDNISAKNCYYSELTGLYWIWKNYKSADYVGTCHYRRYLMSDSGRLPYREEYLELLSRYELITTKKVLLPNSYYYGFSANHNVRILDAVGEAIKALYPDYYDIFIKLVNDKYTYFGNMVIMSKMLYNEYCEWLFSIFFRVEERCSLENGEDAYHKRVFGFISEFLLYVYAEKNRLRVKSMKVAMTEEKAETRELKHALANYFDRAAIKEAKELFLSEIRKRPDLMMEASDITGELRLCMQIISTAEHEYDAYGQSVLDKGYSYVQLMDMFSKLNQTVRSFGVENQELSEGISETAVYIAQKLLRQGDGL